MEHDNFQSLMIGLIHINCIALYERITACQQLSVSLNIILKDLNSEFHDQCFCFTLFSSSLIHNISNTLIIDLFGILKDTSKIDAYSK